MLVDCQLGGICLFACRKGIDTETQDGRISVCSSLSAFCIFH